MENSNLIKVKQTKYDTNSRYSSSLADESGILREEISCEAYKLYRHR